MEEPSKQKKTSLRIAFLSIFVVIVILFFYFYFEREKRQSLPLYTIIELNEALLNNDVEKIAIILDSFTIQESIMEEIYKQAEGSRLEPLYLEKIPSDGELDVLFAKIFKAISKNQAMPKISLDGKTELLPYDLSRQIRDNKFTLVQNKEGKFFTRVHISLPYMRAEEIFFSMEQFGKRWRLKEISNLSRLVSKYNQTVVDLQEEEKMTRIEHNITARLKMNQHIPNIQCVPELEYVAQSAPKLKIHITTGGVQGAGGIMAWGFDIDIIDDVGDILMEPSLVANGYFVEGKPILKNWNINITGEEYLMLASAGKLNCLVSHKYIRLSNETLIELK